LEKSIDFIKYRFAAIAFSICLMIIFIAISATKGGLNYGIDFVGGYKLIVKFDDKNINEATIRQALSDFNPVVQQIGEPEKNEYIVSTKLASAAESVAGSTTSSKFDMLKSRLFEKFPTAKIESEESVGPAIGDYLKKSAWKLAIMAVIMMTLYLAFRFEFKYSVGAMTALLHDVILSVGFCGAMGIEIDIPVIAALLTLYGYSVNDTIVVFDRIRETNELKGKLIFSEVINKAITQTLSRTIITALTTLFAVFALFFLGGEVLHNFATVLLFGLVIGTYSSIFIASPVVYWWDIWRANKK